MTLTLTLTLCYTVVDFCLPLLVHLYKDYDQSEDCLVYSRFLQGPPGPPGPPGRILNLNGVSFHLFFFLPALVVLKMIVMLP